jgi:hypothetical protein
MLSNSGNSSTPTTLYDETSSLQNAVLVYPICHRGAFPLGEEQILLRQNICGEGNEEADEAEGGSL